MKRTQLYIDPATYNLAVWQAKIDGTSVSDIVRKSLRIYVQPKRKQKATKDFVAWIEALNRKYPTPSNTPTDLALEHDHYIYGTPKKYTKQTK